MPLQEWEGHVVEIGDGDFTVSLVDITRGDKHVSKDAVIPLKELSQEDAANLSPGTIFRWIVGHEYSRNGKKKTVSHIVFRDLPRITDEDMDEARERAREYSDARVRPAYPASLLELLSVPTLEPIQEWVGHVVDVGDEYFTARLLDVTSESDYPEEEAEIQRQELSPDDNHRLALGSTFRWIIGYEHYRSGQKKRISQITLHDFQSSRDVDRTRGRRWAAKIRKALT